MIQGINAIRATITPNISHILRNGKTSIPVRPLNSVYAHFKHFIAVPSNDTGAQVPITKIRIIDNLIERLVRLRGKGSGNLTVYKIDEENIDPLIESLEQDLRNSLLAQKPSFTGLFPETGMLINTFA